VDVVGEVTLVVPNGASSVIGIKLVEADDNSATAATWNLATVDTIMIMGNVNAEGSSMPRAIGYDPVEYYNYTQIFRTPLEITRTAMNTKLRTGDTYKEMKRECLELHSIEMEKSAIWGVRYATTDLNNKPKRMSGGLLWFIRTYASANINSYKLNSDYHGLDWTDGGEDWLDYYLSLLFRYAPNEVMAYCGDGALLGLNKLAKTNGNIQLSTGAKSYGIKVTEWQTVHGTINLKTHPLFSHEASTRNMILLYVPKNMRFRPLVNSDTQFQPDQQEKGVDGKVEGYLSEGGFEFQFPDQFMMLEGVGLDCTA
jgi:hypothetical protein